MTAAIYGRASRIVSMLPRSSREIAEDVGVARKTIGNWLRFMRSQGVISYGEMLVHDGWLILPGTGRSYELSTTEQPPSGLRVWCRAWHLLLKRQTSCSLAAALGMHPRTASEILLQMRKHGLVRVCGWEVRGATPTPIYDRLPEPDAPRPARESRVEVNARYWAARRERLARGASA